MTICPIAIAVGCKKCPAFSFCPLTTVLGDQQKEDEVDVSPMTSAHDRDDIWEDKTAAADDHLDKMDDLEKNNNEESWGHWTDEEYLDEVFEYDPICKRCGKGKEGHKVIAVMESRLKGWKVAMCMFFMLNTSH
jgi:hypothetical protein